jgi:hypothetical protein
MDEDHRKTRHCGRRLVDWFSFSPRPPIVWFSSPNGNGMSLSGVTKMNEAKYAKFGAFDADTLDRLLVSDLQTLKVLPTKTAFFSNLLEQFSIG